MKAVLTMFALLCFLAFLSRAHAGECMGALIDLNNETNQQVRFDRASNYPIIGARDAKKKPDSHEKILFDRVKQVCANEGTIAFYAVMPAKGGTFERPAGVCSMIKNKSGAIGLVCDPREENTTLAIGAAKGMK